MSDRVDISLLVCTRTRAASLGRLLASLGEALSAAPLLRIEIIVVDNGSTDDTREVVAAWRASRAERILMMDEPRPGLARARNRAIAAARGAIIAMTDDDCVVHPDYFAALAASFARFAGPMVIGGRILPGDPADLPLTMKTEDHPMIADPGGFPGGFVMGANLAFTASVAARVGPFDERFGAGAPFVAAEDTDFLFRATRLGIAVRYDPRFAVDHFHGRRDVAEETALLTGYSFGDGALYAKHLLRDARVLPILWRDVMDLVRDWRQPVTVHRGIARFYGFRLRHKLRGMLAYAKACLRRGAPAAPALYRIR